MKARLHVLWMLVVALPAGAQWTICFQNNHASTLSVQVGPTSGSVTAGGGGCFSGWYPSTITVSWSGPASGSTSLNYSSGGGGFVATSPNGYQPSGYNGAHTPVAEWTLTLNPAPSLQTRTWAYSLTNATVLARTYRLKVDFESGDDVERDLTVEAGGTLNLSVEDTRNFTVTLDELRPAPDAQGSWYVPVTGLPAVGNGAQQQNWTASAPTSTVGAPNMWGGGQKDAPGSRTDIAPTAQTRFADFTDTTKAVQTLDKNQQARHVELTEVLVQTDKRNTERANVANQVVASGLERVRSAVVSEGERVRDAVTNLTDTFKGPGAATTVTAAQSAGGLDDGVSVFAGWSVMPSIPAAAPPSVEVPLDLVDDSLSAVQLDFGEEHLAGWAGTVRSLVLFFVTLGFFWASWGLLGRAAGV